MKYLFVLSLILFVSISSIAQDAKTIFRAMEDEMKRSLSDLKIDNHETPFFISYTVNVGKRGTINCSLGAQKTSKSSPYNQSSVGLLIGDYQLTNGRFTDKTNKVSHFDGSASISINANYETIRRSLWLKTNNMHKNATEKFKNKVNAMQQNGLNKEDKNSPDFAMTEPLVAINSTKKPSIDHDQLVALAKGASEINKSTSPVVDLKAEISYYDYETYFINSEGIRTLEQNQIIFMKITASALNQLNSVMDQRLEYVAKDIEGLPSLSLLRDDVKSLINHTLDLVQAENFEGAYTGPVMFEKGAVSSRLLYKLMEMGNGLTARPRPLINDAKKGLFESKHASWEDNINQKVAHKDISIIAKPRLKTFNGKLLIAGGGEFDCQGVATPESVILIEDGQLMSQLTDRTPTSRQSRSNGHSRRYYSIRSIVKRAGPAVVHVTTKQPWSKKQLTDKLNELGKEEGVENVFVISSLETNADVSPLVYTSVNLISGERTMLNNVTFSTTNSILKKLVAASTDNYVENSLYLDRKLLNNKMKKYNRYPDEFKTYLRNIYKNEGMVISLIYPESMLLKNVELTGLKADDIKQKIPVSSPLLLLGQ